MLHSRTGQPANSTLHISDDTSLVGCVARAAYTKTADTGDESASPPMDNVRGASILHEDKDDGEDVLACVHARARTA